MLKCATKICDNFNIITSSVVIIFHETEKCIVNDISPTKYGINDG